MRAESVKGEMLAWVCGYCQKRLTLEQVEVDHKDPLDSGGAAAIHNQCVSCKLCNQTKGELSAVHYIRLLEALREMDWAAEHYVLTALRMVGMAKRQRWFPRKPKTAPGLPSSTSY